MNELNLTDYQKNILIRIVYDETEKWYLYMTQEETINFSSQSDRIKAIELYHNCSNLYTQLTGKDWFIV